MKSFSSPAEVLSSDFRDPSPVRREWKVSNRHHVGSMIPILEDSGGPGKRFNLEKSERMAGFGAC